MGDGPVSANALTPPSWKLAPNIAQKTQGLVVSGYGRLPHGRALFLSVRLGTGGGGWLRSLLALAPITDANRSSTPERAAAIAFTSTGLRQLGLSERELMSFSRPFREGMFQEDRLRRLGDRRKRQWCETVLNPDGPEPRGPRWSANTPLRDELENGPAPSIGLDVEVDEEAEEQVWTPLGVNALLLLYTLTEPEADAWAARVKAGLAGAAVDTVHELDLLLDVEESGISREHFGFADGLSQPEPYGLSKPVDETDCVLLEGSPARKHPVQGIPLGEILIGYQNGHSEPAPGPVAEGGARATQANLAPHPLAEGFSDFGRNGSYLVVRELRQDVAAFWQSLKDNKDRIRTLDPSAGNVTEEWLAERIIGRGLDGHLLCPGPSYLKANKFNLPDNDYRFHETDRHGLGCPIGSHVRRANPRDALAPEATAESRDGLLQAANNHRILRRGRKFGRKAQDRYMSDGEERGLLFMCLNTDIERQFEFVQQTWLLNSSFAALFNETDPLLGPAGVQTIHDRPVSRTVDVQSYVRMAGGDYFFLPSLPALAYLSLL